MWKKVTIERNFDFFKIQRVGRFFFFCLIAFISLTIDQMPLNPSIFIAAFSFLFINSSYVPRVGPPPKIQLHEDDIKMPANVAGSVDHWVSVLFPARSAYRKSLESMLLTSSSCRRNGITSTLLKSAATSLRRTRGRHVYTNPKIQNNDEENV